MQRFRGFSTSRASLALCALLISGDALARIVSYAPVTSANAVPAIQRRTNRFFLLVERDPRYLTADPPIGNPVLFDSTGVEPPRTLLTLANGETIASAAYREDEDGTQHILLATNYRLSPAQQQGPWRFLFSRDGGRTFTTLDPALCERTYLGWWSSKPGRANVLDNGGPVARGILAGVRIGTRDTPFVFTVAGSSGPTGASIVAVSGDGVARRLVQQPPIGVLDLIGTEMDGGGVLLMETETMGSVVRRRIVRVALSGTQTEVLPFVNGISFGEGFVTPSGLVYVAAVGSPTAPAGAPSGAFVATVSDRTLTPLVSALPGGQVFAVPTASYDGAWVVERGTSRPTILSLHTAAAGLVEQWRDVTGPVVEAIHSGRSGRRLIVQVNRPRVEIAATQPFLDPALAVWEVGQPAPRRYDELFLVERITRGFVSLDPDRVAEGASFVFDGGENFTAGGGGGPSGGGGGGGGGADVSQEFGIVKASLAQRLVIPAVARAAGAFGSLWRSDVHLRNPETSDIVVTLRYVPTATGSVPRERDLRLEPGEIRVLSDVLGQTFRLESGSGALFLTPSGIATVDATSRTYTETKNGTFGTGVPAYDVATAAHSRFPVYFSAALPGDGFRTNVVAAATTATGGDVLAALLPLVGAPETTVRFGLPGGGHAQIDGLGSALGLRPWETGALRFAPEEGEAVGAVLVIDNGTNDPTMFGPDLAVTGTLVRTIPAIVHADGANGARFRSDLYFANPATSAVTLTLRASTWTVPRSAPTLNLTLLPRETRVIRDVLSSAFGATGVASLDVRVAAGTPTAGVLTSSGVRIASRTYAVTPEGTYGFSMPPLGSFQRARPGDELEILGTVGGSAFRSNLAIVELSGVEAPVTVEILDERGVLLDRFDVRVPASGGLQIDDVFRARGLGTGPPAALIRVRPLGGAVGAYVTLIDNGTNDPVYLGANLASRG